MTLHILAIGSVSFLIIISILLYVTVKRLHYARQQLILTQNKLSNISSQELMHHAEINALKFKAQADEMKDDLTDLHNRQFFQTQLSHILEEGDQYNFLTAILILNIDDFKVINEAYGFNAGDALIKESAKRLQKCIRSEDRLCRFSGDEFIFIVTQIAKADAAAYVAQRILNMFAEPFHILGQRIFLSASIGIALYPEDGREEDILLNKASRALRMAKLKGPNHFQFYKKQENIDDGKEELMLNADLRKLNVCDEFLIYYQPEVNIETKQILCMEAILYWRHPDLGLLHQDKFLPYAEKIGNINEIGDWLVTEACTHYNIWRKKGADIPNIAIKISSRQLENPHFTYKISKLLQEMNISPEVLILEISEVMVLNQMSLIIKSLSLFKQLGVRIGINDFGTGKIALNDLRHFPIDYLKIASALIKDVTLNHDAETIIKAIMMLGNSLGIRVIADGVSTPSQREALVGMGFILMQGSLFSPPVLPQDVTEKLQHYILSQTS